MEGRGIEAMLAQRLLQQSHVVLRLAEDDGVLDVDPAMRIRSRSASRLSLASEAAFTSHCSMVAAVDDGRGDFDPHRIVQELRR